MKALDKVFDTQVITGTLVINFYFIEAKENFLYEEGENRQESTVSKAIVTEENPNRIYQSQSEWTLNDVSSYKL